jgi:hypothetical protein
MPLIIVNKKNPYRHNFVAPASKMSMFEKILCVRGSGTFQSIKKSPKAAKVVRQSTKDEDP